MKAVAIDYAVAATLLELHEDSSSGFDDSLHSFSLEQLSDRLQSKLDPNFDLERTTKVVQVIENIGIGNFYTDPFADPVFQISDNAIRNFLVSHSKTKDVYGRGWNLGITWLKTAFSSDRFWNEFDKEEIRLGFLLPPIEDETFPLDHNSVAFKDAAETMDQLLDAFQKGNDIGGLTPDEAEVAQAELREIRDELDGETVKLPEFGEKVRSVLSWIAKESAGAVIGTLALAALAAILKILVIPF